MGLSAASDRFSADRFHDTIIPTDGCLCNSIYAKRRNLRNDSEIYR